MAPGVGGAAALVALDADELRRPSRRHHRPRRLRGLRVGGAVPPPRRRARDGGPAPRRRPADVPARSPPSPLHAAPPRRRAPPRPRARADAGSRADLHHRSRALGHEHPPGAARPRPRAARAARVRDGVSTTARGDERRHTPRVGRVRVRPLGRRASRLRRDPLARGRAPRGVPLARRAAVRPRVLDDEHQHTQLHRVPPRCETRSRSTSATVASCRCSRAASPPRGCSSRRCTWPACPRCSPCTPTRGSCARTATR